MLCWHVDYWDRLGWKDPFGDAAFSARQKRYGELRKLKQLGTPQYFVDNEALPWSGGTAKIPALLEAGAKRPRPFDVTASAVLDGRKVRVSYALARRELPEGSAPNVHADLDVLPLLVLDKATTSVPRGENEGKTLEEFRIVLAAAAGTDVAKALEKPRKATLDAPKGRTATELRVVLLVEDTATQRTLDAFELPVTPKQPPKPARTDK